MLAVEADIDDRRFTIADRHTRTTKESFGAAWSRQNPGGTHRTWNRAQLAVGGFMISGKKPLFKREGASKYPIAPLWGPNIAREVERHEVEVEADVAKLARARVLSTAKRLLAMEISQGWRLAMLLSTREGGGGARVPSGAFPPCGPALPQKLARCSENFELHPDGQDSLAPQNVESVESVTATC